MRGGEITFHGPGQLVIYPILDLTRLRLTARDYVALLERATIQTLRRWLLPGKRTENPGVWIIDPATEAGTAPRGKIESVRDEEPEKKIAALGVHLRRGITSYGVCLNVHTYLRWYRRIVQCGLWGKGVTSMEREKELRVRARGLRLPVRDVARRIVALRDKRVRVAGVWAEEFTRMVWGHDARVKRLLVPDLATGLDERVMEELAKPAEVASTLFPWPDLAWRRLPFTNSAASP